MKNQILLFALAMPLAVQAAFYDFETCATAANDVNAPNFLPGLTITQGSSTGSVSVGSLISWSETRNGFRASGSGSIAWSGTNTLYSFNLDDTLIRLATPASQVSILSDRGTPENADIVRLIGLASTNVANQFRVVAFDQKNDNETSLAGCTLSLNTPGGIEWLLLETTTESEAWDNLNVTPVPEPSSAAVLVAGIALLARRRGGKS